MTKKIQEALAYVNARAEKEGKENIDDIRNDAANFFSDNYEEYLIIWDYLEGKPIIL